MINKQRKSNGGLIGIDIGSTSIKKLELSRNGDKLRVDDYAVYPLPEGAVVDKSVGKLEVVVSALERVMKSSKTTSTGIAFAIPSANVFIHTERMESALSDQEVQANLNAKLDKIIPFPVSEVAMDYTVEDKLHNLKPVREVVVVAAKSDSIKTKQELFDLAGIKSNVATVESFAVEKVLPLITGDTDKHSILFDFGYSNTIIYAIKQNKIIYARDHAFGGERLSQMIREYYGSSHDEVEALREEKISSQDEDFINFILNPFIAEASQQLNQALQLCMSSTDIYDIGEVLLSGGSARLSGLLEAVQEELGYKVSIACPFKNMELAPGINREDFDKENASLLTVCGLALCDIGDSINLLPWREALEQQKKRSFLTGLTAASILGVGVALGGWLALQSGYNSQSEATRYVQTEIESMDAKLVEYETVISMRDEMLERMKLIQGLQSQRPIMVGVANSIVKAIPNEAYLTSISKDGSVFTFVGKSKDIEVVSEYMRTMKATGWFSDVFMSNFSSYKPSPDAPISNKKPKDEDSYGEFTITATLSDYTELRDTVSVANQVQENADENTGVEVGEPAPVGPAPADVNGGVPVEGANPTPVPMPMMQENDSQTGGV